MTRTVMGRVSVKTRYEWKRNGNGLSLAQFIDELLEASKRDRRFIDAKR